MKSSGSDEGGGIEIQSSSSPSLRPCAYCRDVVADDSSTHCPRCRAVYHPECWTANDRRCAVYGCEPAIVAPVEVVQPPPRSWRTEPVAVSRPRSSGWWIFVVILVINVIRVTATSTSRHHRDFSPPLVPRITIPKTDYLNPPEPQQVPALLSEARHLEESARLFLDRHSFETALPKDLEARAALYREAKGELDGLQRAQRAYWKLGTISPEGRYGPQLGEIDRLIARLRLFMEPLESDSEDR